MMHARDDWNLAKLAEQGDDDAFDRLLQRWQRPVHRFVYRLLGHAEDAEDVAQEVFVRLYRALQRARLRRRSGAFSTWLFQVARHAAYDRQRWRRRHPESPWSEGTDPGGLPADPGGTPTRHADLAELGRAIALAVGELPEAQRTALVLFEYEGMSHDEIGAIMKCSAKSVEARLYRARSRLRRRLAEWEGLSFQEGKTARDMA